MVDYKVYLNKLELFKDSGISILAPRGRAIQSGHNKIITLQIELI